MNNDWKPTEQNIGQPINSELYETQYPAVKIGNPKLSNWTCYLFGASPGNGILYTPEEGRVPNRFVRFMMKVCFDCKWVRNDT